MPRRAFLALAGALSILASADAPRAQGAAPRAFVLDQDARSLTIVDVATGEAVQTATLPGSPVMLRRTGDGKTLLVLDRGAGRDAGDAGFRRRPSPPSRFWTRRRSRCDRAWSLAGGWSRR